MVYILIVIVTKRKIYRETTLFVTFNSTKRHFSPLFHNFMQISSSIKSSSVSNKICNLLDWFRTFLNGRTVVCFIDVILIDNHVIRNFINKALMTLAISYFQGPQLYAMLPSYRGQFLSEKVLFNT